MCCEDHLSLSWFVVSAIFGKVKVSPVVAGAAFGEISKWVWRARKVTPVVGWVAD